MLRTRTDPRFHEIGFTTSESKVQQESGVDKILRQQLNYPNYVNQTQEIYNFWARPTMPWKLECEQRGPHLSRLSVLEAARDTAALKTPQRPKVILLLCSLLAFFSGVCILSQPLMRSNHLVVCSTVMIFFQFALTLGISIISMNNWDLQELKLKQRQ